MIDAIYDLLAQLGYQHPLHPVFVHMPIGLSVGAFCLQLAAWLRHSQSLARAAYAVALLALLFLVAAIPTGIMDWQRFYGGAWLPQVRMKLGLAVLLSLTLALAAGMGWRRQRAPAVLLGIYGLAVATVGGLGYFGGDLVYGSRIPDAPESLLAGQRLFDGRCSGCHQRGGNAIVPSLPLRSAPQLANVQDFLKFLRDPRMPDGSVGAMPAFTVDQLSDAEAQALFDYLGHAFVHPPRQ